MLYVKKRILTRESRKEGSKYRVHCDKIFRGDELLLNIYDENDKSTPLFSFTFSGERLHSLDNIYFDASEIDGRWIIDFLQVQPD